MTATAIPSGPANPLWQQISRFQVGNPDEHRAFLDRLARREQSWGAGEAAEAFQEYLRFIYLAATSYRERTPSQKVDEVWHLHLENRANYERDLCQGVLRRALPHNVGERGTAARVKYRQQYAETLDAYREAFNTDPPKEFWPEPGRIARRLNSSGRLLSGVGGVSWRGHGVVMGVGAAVFAGVFSCFALAAALRQMEMFSEEYVATRVASNGSCGSGCGGGSSDSSSDSGSGGGDSGSGCGGGGCGGGGGD